MNRIKPKLHQRGDTIVEVLIAVAIVSSVLAITFSTMNRNILIMRDNQEHTEASKIAQSQAEALLNLWNEDQDAITDEGNNPFCINGTTVNPISGGSPNNDPQGDGNYTDYLNAGCQTTPDGIYNYAIKRNPATNAYVITVRWFMVGSGTRNEKVIVYRLN